MVSSDVMQRPTKITRSPIQATDYTCWVLPCQIPPTINIQAIKIWAADRWSFIFLVCSMGNKELAEGGGRNKVPSKPVFLLAGAISTKWGNVFLVPKSGFISKQGAGSLLLLASEKIHATGHTHSVQQQIHDTDTSNKLFMICAAPSIIVVESSVEFCLLFGWQDPIHWHLLPTTVFRQFCLDLTWQKRFNPGGQIVSFTGHVS